MNFASLEKFKKNIVEYALLNGKVQKTRKYSK